MLRRTIDHRGLILDKVKVYHNQFQNVKAMRVTSKTDAEYAMYWARQHGQQVTYKMHKDQYHLYLKTLSGWMIIEKGDWLMMDSQERLHVVEPHNFDHCFKEVVFEQLA